LGFVVRTKVVYKHFKEQIEKRIRAPKVFWPRSIW